MSTAVRSCPKCSTPMGSVPLDVEVRCGKCGMTMTFRSRPAAAPAPPPTPAVRPAAAVPPPPPPTPAVRPAAAVLPPPAASGGVASRPVPAAAPVAPAPATGPAPVPAGPDEEAAEPGSGLGPWTVAALVGGGAALLLGAGLVAFLVVGGGPRRAESTSSDPSTSKVAMGDPAKPPDKPADKPIDKPIDKPADKPIDKPIDKPADKPIDKPIDKPADKPIDKPLDRPGGGAEDKPAMPDKPEAPALPAGVVALAPEMQQRVDEAIQKGKDFLLKTHRVRGGEGGQWGVHPLVGLTLLECGVPADDPAVRAIADEVRGAGGRLTDTYGLALAVLFLDRLQQADGELVLSLGSRLVAGQNNHGGWSYQCPVLTLEQEASLGKLLETVSSKGTLETKKPDGLPGQVTNPRAAPRPQPGPRRGFTGVEGLPAVVFRPGMRLGLASGFEGAGDNSNTQFAMLGVWAAQRHGLPAERSLGLAAQRFRESQASTGSWGYPSNWRDSMTCAGLLGLAVGHGVASKEAEAGKPAKPAKPAAPDLAVSRGLSFLGQRMDTVMGRFDAGSDLYFYWSLERVGVIYGVPRIGTKEWYPWGVPRVLRMQRGDGSWQENYGQSVDTCFALLFLKRVNVAKDLTKKINHLQFAPEPGPGTGTLDRADPQRPGPRPEQPNP